MKKQILIPAALILSLLAAGNVMAATPAAKTTGALDGEKLYKEKTCVACHGADGKKTLMPTYPKIAGQNKAYVERQMQDIKSGARANGDSAAMKGVMGIVNEDELKAIADYVSKMKP